MMGFLSLSIPKVTNCMSKYRCNLSITKSYSGFVAFKAVLTFLRISCSFAGVTNVLGK